MTYYEWFAKWKAERKHERLGQAFCNDFIKMPWPELYHCTDDERSAQIIYYYLTDYCYWPNMPDNGNKRGTQHV